MRKGLYAKGEGRYGVKDINMFNMALLSKWKWRLGSEKYDLWKEELESKYESWRMLDSRGLWKRSLNDGRILKKLSGKMYNGQWFRENIRWKMGNDSKINF